MGLKSWYSEILERARQGLEKPSPYGSDVDVVPYLEYTARKEPKLDEERAREVGVDFSARAVYMQVDQAYFKYLSKIPGIEVKSVEDFVEENPDEAKEYLWKLVDPAQDKYTAVAALKGRGGFFIRVKENTRVEEPIMTCMFMSVGGLQAPHNVVVLEKNAQATIFTGCTIAPESFGLHAAVSEFYVGEGAELRYVMVHSWNRVTHVRPRTAVQVLRDGKYVSYYVNMSRVKTLQAYPVTMLGENAYGFSASILLGLGDSEQDVGSAAILSGGGSRAELVSRIIGRDESKIVARAKITANSKERTKGHIECRGLLLSEKAVIRTIPELESLSPEAELTHEAAIGKLSEDEVNYLVSRGFKREEAVGILVRGFISIDVKGLPPRVKSHIETLERVVAERAL